MKKKTTANKPIIDPGAWMITFGDLLMLLLTFFVMLLTMKTMDGTDTKKMFKNYIESSGPFDYISGDSLNSIIGGGRPTHISSSDMLKKALEIMDGVDTTKPKGKDISVLKNLAEITEDNRGVIIVLESQHLFESGEADIRPTSIPLLDEIGIVLRYATNDILIMGHTDDRPIRGGKFKSNWDLSFYRSLSVLYYLRDAGRVRPGRLASGGYGGTMPRYSNDTKENRAKNRRVEFILRKKE